MYSAQFKFLLDHLFMIQIFSGFDIPLDAFSLHHPFLQSHVQEFEWSEWYFLFLTVFYKNSSESPSSTVDVSVLVPELTKALSAKLSVPANTFSISKAEKYRQVFFPNKRDLSTEVLASKSFNTLNI